jgi:glycosyltransferase involved in cell wall biosynthesis
VEEHRSILKVLIIIPSFNEAENIRNVINDIRKHYPESTPVVINDGSTDKTASIARSEGVRVINHLYNLGIGGAVQTGFIIAEKEGYDAAVQFDGDGQHMAEEIEKILQPIAEGVDVCTGSRFLGSYKYPMPLSRKIGTLIFSFVLSMICRQKLTDTTSGFRAYSRKSIKFFSNHYPEDYPEVEALILSKKKKFTIREIPVIMKKRKGGKSSITPLNSAYYMIKVLLAVFIDLFKKYE